MIWPRGVDEINSPCGSSTTTVVVGTSTVTIALLVPVMWMIKNTRSTTRGTRRGTVGTSLSSTWACLTRATSKRGGAANATIWFLGTATAGGNGGSVRICRPRSRGGPYTNGTRRCNGTLIRTGWSVFTPSASAGGETTNGHDGGINPATTRNLTTSIYSGTRTTRACSSSWTNNGGGGSLSTKTTHPSVRNLCTS